MWIYLVSSATEPRLEAQVNDWLQIIAAENKDGTSSQRNIEGRWLSFAYILKLLSHN